MTTQTMQPAPSPAAPRDSPPPHHAGPSEPPTRAHRATTPRNPPSLPTATERLVLAIFPALLVFGSLFSLVSPQTRASAFDAAAQAHAQDAPPSYFAHKGNVFNQWYVKKGWAWTSLAFAVFVAGHPSMEAAGRRARAAVRWGVVTGWWYLVTQWCFGPPVIDRAFMWTGGACEVVKEVVSEVTTSPEAEFFTAVTCKAGGGRWLGGHDVSGHVFLLVLGSGFLLQEVGWVVARWSGSMGEERTVVMGDGAIKGAGVEAVAAARPGNTAGTLGRGGRVVAVVVLLNLWMLLMTAIYFHTWIEKLTGLIAASGGLYAVYILPRVIPAARQVVGLPGI